jgi:hypothetical protein
VRAFRHSRPGSKNVSETFLIAAIWLGQPKKVRLKIPDTFSASGNLDRKTAGATQGKEGRREAAAEGADRRVSAKISVAIESFPSPPALRGRGQGEGDSLRG